MTKTLNKYWGKLLGGLINLYYLFFFFILCCLVLSDVYYFGKITMPETPGYIFIIFFLVPAIYAVKLGVENIARLSEFTIPILAISYCLLFTLVLPKMDFENLVPIMSDGIKPVLGGALPNMNFPYGQMLPIAFYYKYTTSDSKGNKFIKYGFWAVLGATILLTFRSIVSITTFDESTLKTLTFPPFSSIRLIEVGDVLERLDALLLAIFYGTTFLKFVITYYVICQIISDQFQAGSPKDFALPVAILIGVSMPFLIPRFDIIIQSILPYFFSSLPLFIPIPLLLYATIKIKKRIKKH
jgi:spore germination protein KB